MKGFLLDTSIISELAPGRQPSALPQWLRDHRPSVFLPVVAVIEIEKGVSRLARMGGSQRAKLLSLWLDRILETFSDRVLALDVIAARRAGTMSDAARATGRDPGLADVMIAAIANIHELTVATRNLRHFEPLGVPCLDPLAGADHARHPRRQLHRLPRQARQRRAEAGAADGVHADVADAFELDEVIATERQLLYVAATRARDRLFVSGVAPGSEPFDELRPSAAGA